MLDSSHDNLGLITKTPDDQIITVFVQQICCCINFHLCIIPAAKERTWHSGQPFFFCFCIQLCHRKSSLVPSIRRINEIHRNLWHNESSVMCVGCRAWQQVLFCMSINSDGSCWCHTSLHLNFRLVRAMFAQVWTKKQNLGWCDVQHSSFLGVCIICDARAA